MSSQISTASYAPGNEVIINVNRRSANYHPSVWGDHFLTHDSHNMDSDPIVARQIIVLKEEIQDMLHKSNNPLEMMNLVDAIQRLGVAYHFENEIEKWLKSLYEIYVSKHDYSNTDLDVVALGFRLLRLSGYNISSDVFKRFKDENGKFLEVLKNDTKGLLFLYESSHLRVEGEHILEEALEFTSKHLSAMLEVLKFPLNEKVKHSLEIPLHKCMQRLEARHYITMYEADSVRNNSLLELAKLDFNQLQARHQKEIISISRWWKDIDFASKLPFARDRLVECYFWILGVHFEPKYSFNRTFMTKIIAIASVIDDIYDLYGTLQELELFTAAIERWNADKVDELPQYMQVCFMALIDVMKEMEDKLTNEGRSHCVYYAKEGVKGLVRSYFVEAKWFNCGYVPTFEEYLDNSVMSSGYPMLALHSLVGLADLATNQALNWMLNVPKILRSSSLIARLVDDIHTYKAEQERGDAPSGVQCYMKQYGVPEEEACNKLKELVEISWKSINQEIQKSKPLHDIQLLLPTLNFARMMEVLYQDGDGYTNSFGRTKERIASLLVHPIPI